jgi:tetratricopeptide (TPR) repeat protein
MRAGLRCMLLFMKYPRAPFASKVLALTAAAALCICGTSLAQSTAASAPVSMNDRAVVLGILAAEFSLQSGDVAAAANTYYEVAKRSRDTKVAERAVDLLLRARRIDEAKEIVALWQETDGGSVRPHQIALALALTSADEFRAMGAITAIATLGDDVRSTAIMDSARQLALYRDRDFAVKLASVFTQQSPKLPESHYALAVASTGNENKRVGEALLAIDQALQLRPNWPQAVAVKSRLLLARGPVATGVESSPGAAAVSLLESAIAANSANSLSAANSAAPVKDESRELRLVLARTQFDLEKFTVARKLFLALADDGMEDADEMRLAATLSAFQGKDWEVAEREFTESLAADRGDPAAVLYYLARISESRSRWGEAVERFTQVPRGDRYWESQLRIAGALAQDKRIVQAISHLRGLKPSSLLERQSLAQTESTLWREAGENVKAFDALEAALATDADNPDLLYDSAMLAERIDRMEEAEKRLRRVIVLQPARAHAFNALGYSFADRNINLDEARTLIEKAHALAPEDPAILDSMGWIAFRQGRLAEAESYLKRALEKFQDGEIAAHLGEVLWAQGRQEEAKKVWDAQLKVQPDSDILKKTVARLAK